MGEVVILAGNYIKYIIRNSRVVTYIESTFRNMWAVLVSTIFCSSCSDGLPEVWLIKFWIPFFIMSRAPAYNWSCFSLHPPAMRRPSNVSFRSLIGRDVADYAKTSSWRSNWYVNETDLFEMSHWYADKTNQFETS